MVYTLIILYLLNFLSITEWELKKQKNEIKVYTRTVEGSAYKEFRGEIEIENSSFREVLQVLFDVKNFENLFPDCMNPEILKQEGEYYNVHYLQTKAPFPVKNRDGIYELKAEIAENGNYAIVHIKPLPDYIVVKKEFVRIKEGTGFWELKKLDSGNIYVIYQFHGEPGGEIPAWVANNFIVSQPYNTLKNLREILKK